MSKKSQGTSDALSDRRLTIKAVRDLCGGVSHMWIERRLAETDFPKPVKIGRLRFWSERAITLWWEEQDAKQSDVSH
ncbi:helix-turn-helix transcriptional regulator [Roseobacter ponti]|uniref:Transcriptional regulator n=1 Tax=Roseobacter ponti TaxID=1891787 RepID=A0A858SS84_9RHOB|nr:transcriptional regulator [Roseobacter ponti]QJF50692.1 transcriptional regulator [Roseobacter ponti]